MSEVKKLSTTVKKASGLVLDFFGGDRAKAKLWWELPNPLLGNIAPTEMVKIGRAERLLAFIENQLSENEPPATEDNMRAQGIRHAADRLSSRFGYKLDAAAHQEITGLIKNCKWVPIRWDKEKLRVRMEFRGKMMDVVFNRTTLRLVTIIPADEEFKNGQRVHPAPLEMVETPVSPPPPPPPPPEPPKTRPSKNPNCKVCGGTMPIAGGWSCGGCEGEND